MAIIQNGTTDNEKFVIGVVQDIQQQVLKSNISNPAIIVIGEVVRLHRDFERFNSIINTKLNSTYAWRNIN
jgi:uroporphyrin-III C-methyltransferase